MSGISVEQFLERLEGIKKSGKGWQARCPGHDDSHASLSVTVGDDGRILLHCHAGCPPDQVVGALGMKLSDLFPVSALPAPSKSRLPEHQPVKPPLGTPPPVAPGATKTWCYPDADGKPLFYESRYDKPDGSKEFRPWTWDGHGWVSKGWPAPRPLYGLDRLTKNPTKPVQLVEGAKAADAAQKIVGDRYVVVTWPNGAKAVDKVDWTPLHGKKLLLCPDADGPGASAMEWIARHLHRHCPEIKLLDTDGMPEGWDLADAPDTWSWDDFCQWGKPRAKLYQPSAPATLSNGDAARAIPRTLRAEGAVAATKSSGQGDPQETAEHLSDLGNARRLVTLHGQLLRYVWQWGWLFWTGARWIKDETGEVMRRAKQTVLTIYSEIASLDDLEDRRSPAKWALKSEAEPRLKAIVELAKSEPEIVATTDEFDTDPWLLNVQNGTLDLRTGILKAHCREDRITKLVPVDYDPQALCPTWDAFLNRVMEGNASLIGFLQRAIGYALTGSPREQVIFILHGSGANGKTTFLLVIQTLLADYAAQTPTETLLVKKSGSIPNDVARLHGTRLVVAVEMESGKRLAEALVKQLTGCDKITARFLHKEFFEFVAAFKLFLATNHKPEIRGTDNAIWRRIRLIPFNVTIPPEEQDKGLVEKLKAELPGILAWAVRGCLEWQRDGLGVPEAVKQATEGYRAEMDTLAAFLDECCILTPDAKASATPLYAAYKQWCAGNGEAPLTQQKFGMCLTERGFQRRRSGPGGGYQWHGVGILGGPNGLEQSVPVPHEPDHPQGGAFSANQAGSDPNASEYGGGGA